MKRLLVRLQLDVGPLFPALMRLVWAWRPLTIRREAISGPDICQPDLRLKGVKDTRWLKRKRGGPELRGNNREHGRAALPGQAASTELVLVWLEEKGDTFVKRRPHKRPRRSTEGRADRNSCCAFVCVREQQQQRQQRYSALFISTAFSQKQH